ncbi:WD repeat-containing and planar cell polarity effector protein fritz isoform X1 [Nasonia vitripennis]|uniref:WD repeat-containing and planar cell polarity effector protein fritz n=1 Tax=Nasonia vitripennis TaxID=7425 RepID=A0A7M7H942_NASVI|nr:WD repeat-containing and planar cell polarity effector protein fritz isoform X1 [Nasonia vitripennis]
MFVLLGELNFWTFDNDVNIKETDFGAFCYHDKKIDNVYEESKRSYAQKRGMVYVPQNKKGNKMKDSVKYLEEQLNDHSTIHCQWTDYHTMQIMLSSGLLVYIQVNLCSGDIQKIVFDKYLVGKLPDRLSDVIITKNYLICTYNDTQVTLVSFFKPKRNIFDKISRLDPKLSTFDICGPSGRRLEKKIQHNKTEDLILIWWKSTMNEVYPWSPTVKEHDRANVHLYRLTGAKLELLCYLRTEFDPLSIIFNTNYDNVIHSLEQKVSRKGEVTVEWRTYEVSQNDKLQRIAVVSVPLPTHSSCVRFSPNQDMLLLCCIDGSITLHDHTKGTNTSIKAAFIATLACWHSDGNIFAIANERGQVQHFDIALTCVKSQMLSEDISPANIVDLSSYFRTQPALIRLEWSKKSESNSFIDYYNHGDALFLLLFERGPVAIIRIVEGENLSGDTLVQKYLALSQVQQATSLLLAMNWDSNPHICMHSLNQIVNHLFKQPLTPERENLIQNALGSFHVPVKPMSQSVVEEYGDEVRDLTRRFFHHLLRYRLFEKAFRLAIDLNDHDLFMDIHFYAIVLKDTEMATAAKDKAEEIISRCNSCSSSHSTCSRPSCSLCSDSGSEKDESYTDETESEESPKKEKVHVKRSSKHKYSKNSNSQAPPLPILYPPIYNSSGFMSTPFNEAIDKTETNLMSTSFNVPNCSIPSTSYNCPVPNFIPDAYLTSVPYVGTNPGAFAPLTNPTYTQSMRSYDNLISPFRSLAVTNQLTPSVAQSSLNSMSLENITNSYQIGNFLPPTLTSIPFEPKSIEVPASLTQSSIDNTSSNVMSTSFSNLLSNPDSTSQTDTYVGAEIDGSDAKIAGLTVLDTPKTNSVQAEDSVITVKPVACSEPPPLSVFNSGSNLMSTSFNDPEDPNDDTNSNSCDSSTIGNSTSKQKHSLLNIPPPPPSITDSLANYIHNLPKKNYALSRSTPGLADADSPLLKLQHVKSLRTAPNMLQQQNSVSNILQNHHRNNNFQSTRKYRLDYDLDYVPFHNSCDNLSTLHSNINHMKSNSYSIPPKSYESKPFKLTFSQSSTNVSAGREHRLSSNVPPLPVINNSCTNDKSSASSTTPADVQASPVAEKPKVKFSDTVTHILVPTNTGSTYPRPIQKRTVAQMHPMDPKRELAESLPLCLGNDDYLKDFQPLPKEECDKAKESLKTEETAKIKVVHFGLL